MDRLTHSAFSGMRSAMAAQTVTANNLANASTTGFRRDFAEIRALAAGEQGRDARMFANERATTADMTPGAMVTTNRALDVAMQDRALLAVQAPDGTEAYTRRGDLSVEASGLLVNGAGHPVLGADGPITIPAAEAIMIAPDGLVSVRPEGGTPIDLIEVGRLKLVTPADDLRRENDLFRAEDDLIADPAARLSSGTLEGSNVNSADALVNLIEQARRFEMNVGLLTTARELDQASASLLRQE
ncbi:MAG: flagellar basal body rod protein FlgF [Pseudomonadota bacterium]